MDRDLRIKLSIVTVAVGGNRMQRLKLRQRAREKNWTNFKQFRQAMSGGELSCDKQGGNQAKYRDNEDAAEVANPVRQEVCVASLTNSPYSLETHAHFFWKASDRSKASSRLQISVAYTCHVLKGRLSISLTSFCRRSKSVASATIASLSLAASPTSTVKHPPSFAISDIAP